MRASNDEYPAHPAHPSRCAGAARACPHVAAPGPDAGSSSRAAAGRFPRDVHLPQGPPTADRWVEQLTTPPSNSSTRAHVELDITRAGSTSPSTLRRSAPNSTPKSAAQALLGARRCAGRTTLATSRWRDLEPNTTTQAAVGQTPIPRGFPPLIVEAFSETDIERIDVFRSTSAGGCSRDRLRWIDPNLDPVAQQPYRDRLGAGWMHATTRPW